MKTPLNQLTGCFKFFKLNRIYAFPDQDDTKETLAKLGAIFQASGDYDEFYNHRQHLYSVIENRKTRKHAAQQLENMIREKIELWKIGMDNPQKKDLSKYIKEEIIEGFEKKKDGYNYKKLINLLNELNYNVAAKHPYSAKALIRGILDHIPQLLGCVTFNEVVDSYPWGKSNKQFIKQLFDFKVEGDQVLHDQISDKEDLVTIEDIPKSIKINILLQECLYKGASFDKSKIQNIRKPKFVQNLQVDVLNNKVRWANHACDFPSFVWSSFSLMLKINNFISKTPDYISVDLKARGNDTKDGLFSFSHFIFKGTSKDNEYKPNEPFEIGENKIKNVELLISDTPVGTTNQGKMPDFDRDTLELIVTAQSGQVITIPIPPGWIIVG